MEIAFYSQLDLTPMLEEDALTLQMNRNGCTKL